MDFKKYSTTAKIFIFVCSLIIIVLFLFTIYNLFITYTKGTLTPDTQLTALSSCASLIVALISIISIIINTELTNESIRQTNENIEENRKYNQRTINQTNRLIEQNEENRYIELRFKNTQKALLKLSKELQIALKIQYELKNLKSEELLFDSRGFLLMQYVNLIEDYHLLYHIPLKLRVTFESVLNSKIDKYVSKESEAYVCEINSYNKYNYNILVREKLMFYFEFENIVKKFNENCSSGYFKNIFREYYSSDITEEEIENHMKNIVQEIEINKLEKHILDEKETIVLKD